MSFRTCFFAATIGALLASCAAPAPFTASGAGTVAARLAYEECAQASMLRLMGTTRPDAALSVATVAESSCSAQRAALRDALIADNPRANAAIYADSYVQERRRIVIASLAEAMLRVR